MAIYYDIKYIICSPYKPASMDVFKTHMMTACDYLTAFQGSFDGKKPKFFFYEFSEYQMEAYLSIEATFERMPHLEKLAAAIATLLEIKYHCGQVYVSTGPRLTGADLQKYGGFLPPRAD